MNRNFRFKPAYLVLLIIVAIGVYLRFSGILSLSFPYTYDIGRDLLIARDLSNFSDLKLIGHTTGLPGLFYGPTWHYILALLYKPLQGDPVYFTGFIAFTGVLTVFLSFFFGRKIGGDFLGILFASLISFSPVIVSLTGQIWNPTLIPIFWILSLFLLLGIYRKEKIKLNYFLLGFILSLIVDMEIVVGLMYLIGVIIALSVRLRRKITKEYMFYFIFGFVIILSPRIIFEIKHGFLLTKNILSGGLILGSEIKKDTIWFEVFTHKITLIFGVLNDTVSGKLVYLSITILLLSLLVLIKKIKINSNEIAFFINFFAIVIFSNITLVLLFNHDIWPHYLIGFPLFFCALVSLVIYSYYKFFKWKKIIIILSSFYIIFILNPINILHNLEKPLWIGDAAIYRNQVQVIDEVYKLSEGKSFKYIAYTPPVHDYTYRYLFDWYGEKAYRRLPSIDNAEYLFVIIEPDDLYPGRITNWLEIRKNDGKILTEIELPSKIKIQKRILR